MNIWNFVVLIYKRCFEMKRAVDSVSGDAGGLVLRGGARHIHTSSPAICFG